MNTQTTHTQTASTSVNQPVRTHAELTPSLAHRQSLPILGVLPVARVVPMNVHSVLDYASGLAGLSSILFAKTTRAKVAGAALGSTALAVSLTTDYELSAAKMIPIEAHEVIDYVHGFSMMSAPFALGYFAEDTAVSIMHIATGASVILSSLLTDYRAATGVGRKVGELLEG